MLKKSLLLAAALSLSACSVTYEAKPARDFGSYNQEICVVDNPDVRPEFLTALTTQLRDRGFTVRVMSKGSAVSICPLTSTFIGKWSWDFTPYMSVAEIKIFKDGQLIGESSYKAPRGGWGFTLEVYDSTDKKIAGMLEKLFPKQ